MEFKVGDIVSWAGVEGVLRACNANGTLDVSFTNGEMFNNCFSPAGFMYPWHTEPSLKLVRREKKRVKKVMFIPVVKRGSACDAELYTGLWNTREKAMLNGDAIGTVEVEVEMEE